MAVSEDKRQLKAKNTPPRVNSGYTTGKLPQV